jgi:SAM-dependent methyltransferase
VGKRIGWHNVDFRRARIEDLALDLDRVDCWLKDHPVRSVSDLHEFTVRQDRFRRERPLVADASIDIVISNCVLNLVDEGQKKQVIQEIYRVLKHGGRVALSDIVCDRPVPEHLKADADLWSACIAGAMRETDFIAAFEEVGCYGMTVDKMDASPWRVIDGIQFRAATLVAWKGKEGPCHDHGDVVVYRGPFSSVIDDDGHAMHRGERTAVCRKTFGLLSREPYASHFVAIPGDQMATDGSPSSEAVSVCRAEPRGRGKSDCC